MIAEGFTCQRYGFNVGADKFSLLTIENGKTSIMRLSEWTLISQSQKSHSDRLLGDFAPIGATKVLRPWNPTGRQGAAAECARQCPSGGRAANGDRQRYTGVAYRSNR